MRDSDIPDLRKLNYFVQVVQHAGFRPAALHLGITQPVLSRHIQALEQTYGAVLLQRGPKGIHPTEIGEIVLDRAKALLFDARSFPDIFLNDRNKPTGLVRIALPTSFSGRMLPMLAQAVRRDHPGIRLAVQEGSVLNIIDQVINGKVDFGVATSPTQTNLLIEEKIASEEIFLVGREFDDIGEVCRPEDLTRLPLVLCPFPHGMRSIVDQIARQLGISLEPDIEVDGTNTLTALLKSGQYYSLVPVDSLQEEIRSGALKTRRIRPIFFRNLVIISLRERPMSFSARSVTRILRDLAVSNSAVEAGAIR